MTFAYSVIALLVFVLLVFIGPWFTILALNTLFGLGLEVTMGTWFATLWLMILLGAGRSGYSK